MGGPFGYSEKWRNDIRIEPSYPQRKKYEYNGGILMAFAGLPMKYQLRINVEIAIGFRCIVDGHVVIYGSSVE